MSKIKMVTVVMILFAFVILFSIFIHEWKSQRAISCQISTLRNSNDSDLVFEEEMVLIFRPDGRGEINLTGREISKNSFYFNRNYQLTYTNQGNSSIEVIITKVIKHPLDRLNDDFFKKNIFSYEVGTSVNVRIHTLENGYVFYEDLNPVGICVEKERG